jgi:hypothetical protein
LLTTGGQFLFEGFPSGPNFISAFYVVRLLGSLSSDGLKTKPAAIGQSILGAGQSALQHELVYRGVSQKRGSLERTLGGCGQAQIKPFVRGFGTGHIDILPVRAIAGEQTVKGRVGHDPTEDAI